MSDRDRMYESGRSLVQPVPRATTGTATAASSLNQQAIRSQQDSALAARRRTTSSSLAPPPYPTLSHGNTARVSSLKHQPGPGSARSASSSRYTKEGPVRASVQQYQSFPAGDIASWATATAPSESRSRRRRHAREPDTASESGISILSALHPTRHGTRATADDDEARRRRRAARANTDSPLRRWARWGEQRFGGTRTLLLTVAAVVLVKWIVGLGDYSGASTPPLRGDFEAQRHWISLTSSSVASRWLHSPPHTATPVPASQWYHHDLTYWGLDYPPLTAYHSLLLGTIARLSPRTAPFASLRPTTTASPREMDAWEHSMADMESHGELKTWMRATVIWGDLLVYVSAVVVYCASNYAKGHDSKRWRSVVVAAASILLQPALLLVDNGHFQYNSIMLGFTLWAVICFQTGHDLLGAVAFCLSLSFKQMALYFSPAVFAYLFGKCLYLGGREGVSLFLNLAFVVTTTFAILFAPFLRSVNDIAQVLHRVFPFARGLFEDKVANVWCALNVAVKLRTLASTSTLAKLALVVTLAAILPGVISVVWVSWTAGEKRRTESTAQSSKAKAVKAAQDLANDEDTKTPTVVLLPHALFVSALAFFLFSFQVHEKSILLPLMPLTLLMGAREAGYGRMDWEWAVLVNNIGVFSMWPLLRRDGLGLAYLALTLGWNALIGYNPFSLRRSFVKYLSLTAYAAAALLHGIEVISSPPSHLPDLFVVLNVAVSVSVFGLAFLWGSKRLVQEGWAVVGI